MHVLRGRAAVARWLARSQRLADSMRDLGAPAARRMVLALDHAIVIGELRLQRVVVAVLSSADPLPSSGTLQ